MGSAISPSCDNLLYGKGRVYVDVLTSAEVRTGEIDLGQCDTFQVEWEQEIDEVPDMRTDDTEIFCTVDMGSKGSLTITGIEFSDQHIRLLNLGTAGTHTQSSGSIGSSETITIYHNKWMETDYENITSGTLTLKDSTEAVTYTETTDYIVDYKVGRIKGVSTGSISDGESCHITAYSYGSVSVAQVELNTDTKFDCFVRYVGDSRHGENHHVVLYKVTLRPDGGYNYLTNKERATWTLSGTVYKDTTNSKYGYDFNYEDTTIAVGT